MKHSDTTTGRELSILGKRYFGGDFGGILLSDSDIPRDREKYYIINTDISTGEGRHWIAVVYEKEKDNWLFNDSLSIKKSLNRFYKTVKKSGGNVVLADYNDSHQSKFTSDCGQYALSALILYKIYGRKLFLDL